VTHLQSTGGNNVMSLLYSCVCYCIWFSY